MTGACRRRVLAAVVLVAAASAPTQSPRAQMMLPGALNGNAPGAPPKASARASGSSHAGEAQRAPPKPIAIKPPSEDTIVGHLLSRDGVSGAMAFDRSGTALVLSKLTLNGDKISAPGKPCSIDVSLTPPLVVTPAGRPEGAVRFSVPLAACPFFIDVLDGAVLVSNPAPTCDFKAADCRVNLAGLWGPTAAEISPKRAKDLERQRVRVETTMRANFRVLLKRAGKDRTAVKAIAREQAGFSSEREMTCRDYAQESIHGFCSTQITEARVLALLAKFGDEPDRAPEHRHGARAKPRPTAPAVPLPTAGSEVSK